MRWSVSVGVAAVLLVAGCGSNEPRSPANSTPTATVSPCLTNDAVAGSTALAQADLDGDGGPDAVNFLAGSGACSNLVLSNLDGQIRVLKAPVNLSLRRVTVKAITIPGRRGQLLVAVVRHPRGGFQPYVFGYAAGRLAQLTVRGRPLIGFVATDTGLSPFSAHCTAGGIQVDTARQSAGTWTVRRQTFTLSGNDVTRTRRSVVVSGLSDDKLTQQYAGLVRHDLFGDCG